MNDDRSRGTEVVEYGGSFYAWIFDRSGKMFLFVGLKSNEINVYQKTLFGGWRENHPMTFPVLGEARGKDFSSRRP
ncbi:hypothetical protein SFRURICE_010332, partial [Spodoptera frugiperda]